MKISLRKKVTLITVLSNLALLLICAVYAHLTAYSLSRGTDIIPCFVKNNLHFYCPGCGGSRSVVAIFELDLLRSLIYFPATLYTVALILYCDLMALLSVISNSYLPLTKIKKLPFLLIPVIVMLNFLVRNILLSFGIDYLGDIIKG